MLVTKPHNKTPYELLHGRLPSIGFMRPFGCPVTILNTLDPLSKFQGKVDEGFLVGYSVCSKAFRVFNSKTRIIQETLHVNLMENKPNVAGSGPAWLFNIDREEGTQTYVLFPMLSDGYTNPKNNNKDAFVDGKEHDDDIQKSVSPDIYSTSSGDQTRNQGDKTENKDKGKSPVVTITGFRDLNAEFEECINNSSNKVNAAGSLVSAAGLNFTNSTNDFSAVGPSNAAMPNLEDLSHNADDVVRDQGGISQMFNEDFHTCMFACFLSQEEPKRVHQALKDPSWIEAMQENLLQNKKDERGIVIRNKARLVTQGHIQEEGIDYEEVFALVARIEAIRLFLAYASFMGFPVYQIDVKSAFLYGIIKEEVYVCQPPGFKDPEYPDKVYKVVKALYGLHQAPKAWYETLATYLLKNRFQRGTIDQTLFIKKQQKDIILVQIYIDDIIFGATNKAQCKSFEKLMKDNFEMSSMGELTFFLGLQNTDDDATFKVKEPDFEVEKPESEVHVSPSNSAKTKKHDDKTKREAKGDSPVELSIGFRNLSKEFEAFSDNSINEVNPANTSQYPDDLNMPALEDITYSDDVEDVGAEVDFTNLETTIIVSPILITRVHKDHLVTQIVGDLSTATQTSSMTRMVKYQGGLTQINNEDFHTCMFAWFLFQEKPKRVHQALKDPSWIEAMQEELI
nr:hypothetical protein [Tanacetum cinerariifolium]